MNNRNLWQRYFGYGLGAQIATLLTLMLAAIFLFVAVTINIGKVSQKKTVLSNAADASVLEYASSIGSYSHYLSETYVKGKLENCEFSWSLFFKAAMWALIIAVITGNFVGFLGLGDFAAGIGGLVGGAVGFVTQGPLYYMEADAWKGLARQINKMSRQMKFKESVFLSAMSRVVDDPRLIVDEHDYDEDGLTDDMIPPFLKFFYDRLNTIEQRYTIPLKEDIDDFKLKTQLFNQEALKFKSYLNGKFEPLLERIEGCPQYELSFWERAIIKPESCEEYCARDTRPCKDNTCQIFKDGCPNNGSEEECITCEYDCSYERYLNSLFVNQVSTVISEIDEFSSFVCGDAGNCQTDGACAEGTYQGLYCQDTDKLAENISDWLPLFFDSALNDCDNPCTAVDERNLENKSDYYDVVGNWSSWIDGWIRELQTIDERIKECKANPESDCGDEDDAACCCFFKKDEISEAIRELEAFKADISVFQKDIIIFYDGVNALDEAYEKEGKVYSWHDKFGDQQARHYVKVELSKFNMPRIKSYVKDHHKCIRLVHPWGRVWVEISRYDESHKGYPLWRFRYHPEEDSSWCASKGEEIFDEKNYRQCQKYLIKAYSQASYSYTKQPPKLKSVK